MKKEIKRYLVSSAITFIATFFLLVGFALDQLNWEIAGMSALYSISFVALRGAVKVAWEVLAPLFYKLIEYAKNYLQDNK